MLLSRVRFLQPHELQPIRLLYPLNSPGKNTGMGCHLLIQELFLTQGSNLSLCIAGGFFTIWATRDSFRDCLIIKKHNWGLVEVRPWTSNQVVRVLAWQCHLLAGCLFSEILLSSSIWGVVVLRRSWIFNWEWLSLWENTGLVNVLPDGKPE